MSIPATQRPGPHPSFATDTAAPLSSAAWRRVRLTLTAGLFVAATIAGVDVGLQGAAVSPVAPVAATAAGTNPAPAPLVGGTRSPANDHRARR